MQASSTNGSGANVSELESGLVNLQCDDVDVPASFFNSNSHRITVIITTSPVKSNPCTKMLEEVLRSFVFAGTGLAKSRIIIACDGCNVNDNDPEKPPNYRGGRVDPKSAARYMDYKLRLKAHCGSGSGVWKRCEVNFLDRRYGFGFAVRETLKLCETEYVLIVQHDRSFMRSVNLEKVVCAIDEIPAMNFVGFHTSSTVNYKERMESKYQTILPYTEAAGYKFLPMIYWFDSTHLARTMWYKDFVFGRDENGKRRTGGKFIESDLGQAQLKEFVKGGLKAHASYGTYLLDDEPQHRAVGHINGRTFDSNDQSWKHKPFPEIPSV